MSNGGRRISASPAVKKTNIAGSCQSSHQGCQALTMPGRDNVPAAMATLAAASTNGSSYASSCAAARRPPRSAYLLAEAHAAMSTATTPTPTIARTKNSPMSSGCATSPRGGPRRHVLLLDELDPVGDELCPAVVGTGVHRAKAALHMRHHLVLGLPDDERQGEERHEDREDPDRQLQPDGHLLGPPRVITRVRLRGRRLHRPLWPTAFATRPGPVASRHWAVASDGWTIASRLGPVTSRRGPVGSAAFAARPGPVGSAAFAARPRPVVAGPEHARLGTPFVRVGHAGRAHLLPAGSRRVVALPRLLGARPVLGHPRGEHELLAQRVPLELRRQQQRLEVGVPLEVDAEHLVGLALGPGRTGVDVHNGVHCGRGSRYPAADQGAVSLRRRPEMDDHGEAPGQLIDGGEPIEEVEAGLVDELSGGFAVVVHL